MDTLLGYKGPFIGSMPSETPTLASSVFHRPALVTAQLATSAVTLQQRTQKRVSTSNTGAQDREDGIWFSYFGECEGKTNVESQTA